MNPLREAVEEYLKLRRGLGYQLVTAAGVLRRFAAFMEARQATRITTQLALLFATAGSGLAPATMKQRLNAVRGLARYQLGADFSTEIPPTGLLPPASVSFRPYIYSIEEVERVVIAAKAQPKRSWTRFPVPLWWRYQSWMYHCVFGLLAVTGMRVGEVLKLEDRDIDWASGVLTIRKAKFGKSRLVPLHRTTVEALATYHDHRERFFARYRGHTPLPRLFVSSYGKPLDVRRVNEVFLDISRKVGLRARGARRGPRLHDFRHRFAVETLVRWYRQGQAVDRILPVLSTYLGHANVSCTYWYLRCTPELLLAAGNRLEARWGGVQ